MKKKKWFGMLAIVVVMTLIFTSTPETKAGIFGKYGNFKPYITPTIGGGITVGYHCNYSLASNCYRKAFQ